MTKGKKVVLVLVGIVLLGLLIGIITGYKMFGDFLKKREAIKVMEVDITKVADGVYTGELDLKFNTSRVEVTVKDKKITDIKLLEHSHGPDPKYDGSAITKRIVEKQSLNVEAISGATGSSIVIRKSVENALRKGITN